MRPEFSGPEYASLLARMPSRANIRILLLVTMLAIAVASLLG